MASITFENARDGLTDRFLAICDNVYFQPPEGFKLQYPCIVFHKKTVENIHANGKVYGQKFLFEVTVMDKDPDGDLAQTISKWSKTKQIGHNRYDNIYHDIFNIYY